MIYLSAPTIARLAACSRINSHLQMRAGRFGPLLQRGRVPYAALDAVEHHLGQRFTTEQVTAAVAGRPDRMIVIKTRVED